MQNKCQKIQFGNSLQAYRATLIVARSDISDNLELFDKFLKCCKKFKNVRKSQLDINWDSFLQIILYCFRKYSKFFSEFSINRNNFVFKTNKLSTIEILNDEVAFIDWIIIPQQLSLITGIKTLYHTSKRGGLKYLTPTYGGIGKRTIFSKPRIYGSTTPTNLQAIPIMLPEADSYLADLNNRLS